MYSNTCNNCKKEIMGVTNYCSGKCATEYNRKMNIDLAKSVIYFFSVIGILVFIVVYFTKCVLGK